MFPASTHNGQSVLAFPDVCKTPVPVAGAVPIAYPTMGTFGRTALKQTATKTATKTETAPKTVASEFQKKQTRAQELRGRLSDLNRQLTSLSDRDPTRWHKLVDQYVMTTAELYKALAV